MLLLLALLAIGLGAAAGGTGVRVSTSSSSRRPTGPFVPSRRTDPAPGTSQFGPDRVRTFISAVYPAFLAAGASSAMAGLLTAHSALAVGWGRVVWNWNIGVLRAGPTWAGTWTQKGTREWDPARGAYVPDAAAAWRAYVDLTASAADLIRLISTAQRYAAAWRLLQAGDPQWFSELGRAGFYTEPADRHFPRYRAALARVTSVLNERR